MRVVVTGATGNVGTAVLGALLQRPEIDSIVGVARRRPDLDLARVDWATADVTASDLAPIMGGVDAVVHLAWAIQPSRDPQRLHAVNVLGSQRVFEAAARAGVGAVVHASSIGAYSPGPKDRQVDESWPTQGIESSFYSRHKAEVERLLDRFERQHPDIRVVRMRPGLIFRRQAATEIRRLFLGSLFPGSVMRRWLAPAVPKLDRLRFQVVHTEDAGDAYALAVVGAASGAFNLASDPVIDSDVLAGALGARQLPLPEGVLRGAAAATWRMRLQPTPPGWVDLALRSPLIDSSRARGELGWRPRRGAVETLAELAAGLRDGAGFETPPLDPRTSGPARIAELRSGIGARN